MTVLLEYFTMHAFIIRVFRFIYPSYFFGELFGRVESLFSHGFTIVIWWIHDHACYSLSWLLNTLDYQTNLIYSQLYPQPFNKITVYRLIVLLAWCTLKVLVCLWTFVYVYSVKYVPWELHCNMICLYYYYTL